MLYIATIILYIATITSHIAIIHQVSYAIVSIQMLTLRDQSLFSGQKRYNLQQD